MIADKKSFFISLNPGLESLSYQELCERWSQLSSLELPIPEWFRGGFEFEAPVELGLTLNYHLRSSSRVLLRWKTFSCESLEDFQAEAEAFPWKHFFFPKSGISLKFTSRSSKLSFQKQIESCLKPILKKNSLVLSAKGSPFFVRIFRDECQISIDTTGDRGQFRGGSKKVGPASLRDNLAATLLRPLLRGLDLKNLTLVDPMMGSGTFLIESLDFRSSLKRGFAFEEFPFWKKRAREERPQNREGVHKVVGFEKNFETYDVAKANLEGRKNVTLFKEDVFRFSGQDSLCHGNTVLVVNPPWGKRLKDPLSRHWLMSLMETWRPLRIGVLWPMKPIPKYSDYELVQKVFFENSGVSNQFLIFVKS